MTDSEWEPAVTAGMTNDTLCAEKDRMSWPSRTRQEADAAEESARTTEQARRACGGPGARQKSRRRQEPK